MTLSDLLPIVIVLSVIVIVCIWIIIKTLRQRRREKFPELDDYIIAEFEKEYKRLKKEKEKDL